MAKWIKVDDGKAFVRESAIEVVRLENDEGENEILVFTADGTGHIAHSQDETTQDFIELFRGLDIGDQA